MSSRFPRLLSIPAALGLAALAPDLSAQTLLVGGPDGLVHEVSVNGGPFEFVGTCGGPINSMIQLADELLLADSNGVVYAFDLVQGLPATAFSVTNDATAMVSDGADLLVSGTDGTIHRVDPSDGALLGTFQAGTDIQAMQLTGTELFSGSWDTSIFQSDSAAGGFQLLGLCGGMVNSLARDGNDLWIGARHFGDTATGHVYHYAIDRGLLSYRFDVANDAVAIVVDGPDLLVAGSSGTILRADSTTGVVSDTLISPVGIAAVVLRVDAVPVPQNYCATSLNSTGSPATMSWSGSTSVAANDFVLMAAPMQTRMNGVFLQSPDQTEVPFGNGILSVGNQTLGFIVRLGPEESDASGMMSHALDMTSPSTGVAEIVPGSTWNFSCWYRDIPAGGSYYDFADGLRVTFAP